MVKKKVLPREITFDTITDEPTHIDFLRIVKGLKNYFRNTSKIYK